jgi:hypothetical protein
MSPGPVPQHREATFVSWVIRVHVLGLWVWGMVSPTVVGKGPWFALGVVGGLALGRIRRGTAWRGLPDPVLGCLPYWGSLTFHLGGDVLPIKLLILTGAILGIVLVTPSFNWASRLRQDNPALWGAILLAPLSLIVLGVLLVKTGTGFSLAHFSYLMGSLAVFFAGVPFGQIGFSQVLAAKSPPGRDSGEAAPTVGLAPPSEV